MAIDLSRSAFEPRKRYAGVRMQQGRVLYRRRLQQRREIARGRAASTRVLDVIGPAGTPDGGFVVRNAATSTGRASRLRHRRRHALSRRPARCETDEHETFQLAGRLAAASPRRSRRRRRRASGSISSSSRSVQQAVTASRTPSCSRPRSAGPDTSARTRAMRRVRVAPGRRRGRRARQAWAARRGSSSAALGHRRRRRRGERVVDAQLTVGLDARRRAATICARPRWPAAISAPRTRRSACSSSTRRILTWGFDNASPLYRVQVGRTAAASHGDQAAHRAAGPAALAARRADRRAPAVVGACCRTARSSPSSSGHPRARRGLLRPRHGDAIDDRSTARAGGLRRGVEGASPTPATLAPRPTTTSTCACGTAATTRPRRRRSRAPAGTPVALGTHRPHVTFDGTRRAAATTGSSPRARRRPTRSCRGPCRRGERRMASDAG